MTASVTGSSPDMSSVPFDFDDNVTARIDARPICRFDDSGRVQLLDDGGTGKLRIPRQLFTLVDRRFHPFTVEPDGPLLDFLRCARFRWLDRLDWQARMSADNRGVKVYEHWKKLGQVHLKTPPVGLSEKLSKLVTRDIGVRQADS